MKRISALSAGAVVTALALSTAPSQATEVQSRTVSVAIFNDADTLPAVGSAASTDELAQANPNFPGDAVDQYLSTGSLPVSSDLVIDSDSEGSPVIQSQANNDDAELLSESRSDASSYSESLGSADARGWEWDTFKFWSDSDGRGVRLRYGRYEEGQGWGARKMYRKHNLTSTTAKRLMRKGYNIKMEGSARRYRRPAELWVCTIPWGCRKDDQTWIRVIVETKIMSDHMQRGIITGYCEGRTRCKDWVKRSF